MIRRLILGGALALAANTVAAQDRPPVRFDNWLYYQRNIDDTARWQYRPRFYIPFALSEGWIFTQRVDLPIYYTDRAGAENPGGGWKAGVGDWFIEESFATPEVAKNLKLQASVRFVFPTGGGSPFGSNQYQWAPLLGAVWTLPDYKLTLNPLARYFMSYHAAENGAAKVRRLDLYPTATLALGEGWSFGFYIENAISYNEITKKWFVPLDGMLLKRVSKDLEFGLGAAYGAVKDDPQYQSMFYGRLTLYF